MIFAVLAMLLKACVVARAARADDGTVLAVAVNGRSSYSCLWHQYHYPRISKCFDRCEG
jgi:hypothetical protein